MTDAIDHRIMWALLNYKMRRPSLRRCTYAEFRKRRRLRFLFIDRDVESLLDQ